MKKANLKRVSGGKTVINMGSGSVIDGNTSIDDAQKTLTNEHSSVNNTSKYNYLKITSKGIFGGG